MWFLPPDELGARWILRGRHNGTRWRPSASASVALPSAVLPPARHTHILCGHIHMLAAQPIPHRTASTRRGLCNFFSHIVDALVRHLTQLTVMFLVIHGVYLAFPLSQCPQSIFTLLSVVFSGTVLVLLNLLSKFIATVQITYIGTFPISCS